MDREREGHMSMSQVDGNLLMGLSCLAFVIAVVCFIAGFWTGWGAGQSDVLRTTLIRERDRDWAIDRERQRADRAVTENVQLVKRIQALETLEAAFGRGEGEGDG